MNSSEEYLDNLLKSLLEGENKANLEPRKSEADTPEALFASIGDVSNDAGIPEGDDHTGEMREKSASTEANKAMSTDEIEEMLASMSDEIVTSSSVLKRKPVTDETGFEDTESEEIVSPEDAVLEEVPEMIESQPTEGGMPEEPFSVEKKTLPEETTQEESVAFEDWALEEDNPPDESTVEEDASMKDWAVEDTLSDEPVIEEDVSLEDWALEEESLPDEPIMEKETSSEDWALEEDNLPDESIVEEDASMKDWVLEEDALPDELVIEEPSSTEEGPLEGNNLPEESVIENDSSMEEWTTEEDTLSAETVIDENFDIEKWALEDNSLPEETDFEEPVYLENILSEESDSEETSDLEVWDVEENNTSEEPGLEGASDLEEQSVEENSTSEEPDLEGASNLEEQSVEKQFSDEGSADVEWEPIDNILPEATSLPEGWALDDDVFSEDMNIAEITKDQILDDLGTMEKDQIAEGQGLGDVAPETVESEKDDLADLLEDLSLSESESKNIDQEKDDITMGDTMSEEDIDRLLGDNFTSEETGEGDEGLSELLESMGHDEDLSAINDLLEKADQGLMEDDEMLALLQEHSSGAEEENDEGFDFWERGDAAQTGTGSERDVLESSDGLTASKSGKKKKEKKKKKSGKDNVAEKSDKPKKRGFFIKLLESLLEEEDESSEDSASTGGVGELGSISEENQELLDELSAEDKKNAKKKEKKKKEPKKKEKDDKKAKKAPKPKKPKKEKKVKDAEPAIPEKRISKTKIIFVVIFCTTVAVAIIVVNMFIPDYMQKQEAREMYDSGQYEEAYSLLYGKELSEEEASILQRSNIILQVNRKWNSYENYSKLGMSAEALNALIEGVDVYHLFIADAQQYGVDGEIDGIYARILAELSGNYGVSEEDALNIIASEDDLTYSEKLYSILNGTGLGSEEEDQPKVKQDVLPEEEEIIDRLESPDSSEEQGNSEGSDLSGGQGNSMESDLPEGTDLLGEQTEGDL